jgi:hypothetical protein
MRVMTKTGDLRALPGISPTKPTARDMVNASLPRRALDERLLKSGLKDFTGVLTQIFSGREQ